MSYCCTCCNGMLTLAEETGTVYYKPPNTLLSLVSGSAYRTLRALSPKGTQQLGLHSDGADSCSAFLHQFPPNFALSPLADFVSLVKYTLSQQGRGVTFK